ncbi:MAG: hypothetical protein RSC34_01100 [Alistipes sp.]
MTVIGSMVAGGVVVGAGFGVAFVAAGGRLSSGAACGAVRVSSRTRVSSC